MREEEGEETGKRKESNSKTRSDRGTGENKKQPLSDHHTHSSTHNVPEGQTQPYVQRLPPHQGLYFAHPASPIPSLQLYFETQKFWMEGNPLSDLVRCLPASLSFRHLCAPRANSQPVQSLQTWNLHADGTQSSISHLSLYRLPTFAAPCLFRFREAFARQERDQFEV